MTEIEAKLFYVPEPGTAKVRQCHDGVQVRVAFPNGYEASVVCHGLSYGHEDGLWELAVMRENTICHDSGITGDVEGHLTPERVTEILREISALAPR